MKIRAEAFVALLFAVAVMVAATAGVAAITALDTTSDHATDGWLSRVEADELPPHPETREDTLSGTAERMARPPSGLMPTPAPSPSAAATAATHRPRPTAPPPPPAPEVAGIGSNYPGTAGWIGEATVALPGDLGGRYNGHVNGYVMVCADRCARLPVVDWCQCYWGTGDQRIVDLSHPAWSLVTDRPLAEGLLAVRVILER